jgi:hypothetical protein
MAYLAVRISVNKPSGKKGTSNVREALSLVMDQVKILLENMQMVDPSIVFLPRKAKDRVGMESDFMAMAEHVHDNYDFMRTYLAQLYVHKQSRCARVVDVVLVLVQQSSGSIPSVYCGFSPQWFSPQWPFPHTLHTGGYRYGSPTFRLKVSMGFSLLGVPLKYSTVVQPGARYCGSRSVCWLYGIIGSVQAQLKLSKLIIICP